MLLTQQQIAERAGISQPMVGYILRGDRTPSVETAIKLEKATAVCREAWLWPADRHWNPYIPMTDSIRCTHCENRIGRVQQLVEFDWSHLDTVQDMMNYFQAIIKNPPHVMTSIRKIIPEGLKLIGVINPIPETPELITTDMAQEFYDHMHNNGAICISSVHAHHQEGSSESMNEYAKRLGFESVLTVGHKGLVLSTVSVGQVMVFNGEAHIKLYRKFISKVHKHFII